MLASIRRLPLRQAPALAESLAASRPSARSFSQLRTSTAVSPKCLVSQISSFTASTSRVWSPRALASRAFTSNAVLRQRDALSEMAEENQAEPAPATTEGAAESATKVEEKKQRERDATFASLKGHISYPTWKALTVKPFGYTDMSPVQERVLNLLPELASSIGPESEIMSDGKGRDLLVKAKTGTGKTIAFLVPAIEGRVNSIEEVRRGKFSQAWQQMLDKHRPGLNWEALDKHGRTGIVKQFSQNTVGALILSPTRELATQIATEATKLLHHHDDLQVQLLVGGASRNQQINMWRRGRPDIVVATPGRVIDLLKDVGMIREAMSGCRTLVLDEADTLLEMGFRDELQEIMDYLPKKEQRQTMLFSATVSQDIQRIARASLDKQHRFIDCVPAGEDNVHKHIPQYATVVEQADQQIPHMLRLIAHDQLVNPGKSKVIVFAPTTKLTQLYADVIRDYQRRLPLGRGSSVYEIHSKKDQNARFNTSDRFRKDSNGGSVLVTSDVSARGVDYPGTTRVIQMGVPSNKDQYIHRIGRTGRAGAKGRADIVLLDWEQGFLHFQLDDLPVQKLSVETLEEELQELAKRFDEHPEEFETQKTIDVPSHLSKQKANKYSRRAEASSRAAYKIVGPLTDKYSTDVLSREIEEHLSGLEEGEVREAFMSMLGFYMGRVPELRTTKMSILQGLKRWSVEAGKLEREPHIGDEFMKKLGISTRERGDGGRGGYGRRGSEGRGRFSREDGSDGRPSRYGGGGGGGGGGVGGGGGRGGYGGGFGGGGSRGGRDGGRDGYRSRERGVGGGGGGSYGAPRFSNREAQEPRFG